MCLFYLFSRIYPHLLGQQAIHHVGIVLCLIGIRTVEQAELQEFAVRNVIQSEEVGTRLFDGISVILQRITIGSRKQPPASMTQAFMEICVQIVCLVGKLIHPLKCFRIDDKLLTEAVSPRRHIVSVCKIRDGNAFRTMLRPDPVGIREVDSDGRRGVFVSTQHRSAYHIRRNASHGLLLKASIYRRMVFEPLSIRADNLRALGCL